MQNFDKASFLSDQPEHDRLFLWRFIESQMFATLIDNKILSNWGEVDHNLKIFDNRIKLLKQRYGGENLLRSLSYEPCTFSIETQKMIERRVCHPGNKNQRNLLLPCTNERFVNRFREPTTKGDTQHKTDIFKTFSPVRQRSVEQNFNR